MRTSSCIAVLALRMRVSMSAMGSVSIVVPPHQLDFVRPGISPAWASSRRHTRQRPNLRNTERARPQRRHRVYPRTLNFGLPAALLISAFLAMLFSRLFLSDQFFLAPDLTGPRWWRPRWRLSETDSASAPFLNGNPNASS